MNCDTGELRRLIAKEIGDPEERLNDLKRQMVELEKEGFQEVPSELRAAAEKKLSGEDKVFVSLTSGGKLSKWAASERKRKRKAVAESRKKNRRK